MNGFSLSIFFPSGNPDGLRVIEKQPRIARGLVFPRVLLTEIEVRKRKELAQACVYILWSPTDESNQLPRAYVGESDDLLKRLDRHVKEKGFWTYGVVFTSKDQNLNKAHVKHLEARLLRLAEAAKRCELENDNMPQPRPLSELNEAYVEAYLAELLLCLPAVGISIFERPSASTTSKLRELDPTDFPMEPIAPVVSKHDLHLHTKKGITARGYKTANAKSFTVRAGATAVKNATPSISPNTSQLRKRLIGKGVLEDTGIMYRLAQDYPFNSPSQAASVLMGTKVNGRTYWKDAEGQSLKEIGEDEAKAEQP